MVGFISGGFHITKRPIYLKMARYVSSKITKEEHLKLQMDAQKYVLRILGIFPELSRHELEVLQGELHCWGMHSTLLDNRTLSSLLRKGLISCSLKINSRTDRRATMYSLKSEVRGR